MSKPTQKTKAPIDLVGSLLTLADKAKGQRRWLLLALAVAAAAAAIAAGVDPLELLSALSP